MDIDICGPSVPKMLGLEGEEIHQSNLGWSPVYVQVRCACCARCARAMHALGGVRCAKGLLRHGCGVCTAASSHAGGHCCREWSALRGPGPSPAGPC